MDVVAPGASCVAMYTARRATAPATAAAAAADGGAVDTSGPVLLSEHRRQLYHAVLGTRVGRLQVLDIRSGDIVCELALLDAPIRSVTWADADTVAVVVAAAADDAPARPQSPASPRASVLLVNLATGATRELKSVRCICAGHAPSTAATPPPLPLLTPARPAGGRARVTHRPRDRKARR